MGIEQEFKDRALTLYPGLAEAFDEYEGLLHMQMSEFEMKTTEAIRNKDKEKVLASFILAERCFRQGDEAMKNAIDVSFVEGVLSLLNKEEKEWGWVLMPELLKELYVDFWGRLRPRLRLGPKTLALYAKIEMDNGTRRIT
ncbi:hypothetical protein A3197_17545 [Candidatus Thiodiazotropha endoloripes]|nr:hypothetical protein A3197_17545 [Candidatus Thiodiazotropha endoloripes]